MDPDTLLDRIRDLYQLRYPDELDCVQLAQAIEDLDVALTTGMIFLPKDWQAAR